MKNVICVWKPKGLTPLDAINQLKINKPEYKFETISYAGRLDPMAEGVLLLLISKENKKREKYLNLNKEYEAEIILGISTDTYDGLGLISKINLKGISKKELEENLISFKGKQSQKYPPFSSKTVKGKPLYWWARNKKLNEIKIPSHDIEIYSTKLLDIKFISAEILSKQIIKNVKKVKGDFRQKEVIDTWEEFRKIHKEEEFIKIKINISCSSGTYIRQLANDLGEIFDIGAFAFSIKRIKVGNIRKVKCLLLNN